MTRQPPSQEPKIGATTLRHDSRPSPAEQYRVNHRIRIPRVRVIGADGAQVGIIDTPEALRMAREEGLDLVEISPKAVPPVCKIMDYGRFKYEEKKKANEAKKKQVVVKVKEVKLRPKTEEHDYETKLRHVREFIEEGNKAKITIMFRGREVAHPELGRKILDQVAEAVHHTGKVEVYPKLDGPRNMIMVLAPDKKAQAEAKKKAQTDAAEAAEGASADGSAPAPAAGPAAADGPPPPGGCPRRASPGAASPWRGPRRARCAPAAAVARRRRLRWDRRSPQVAATARRDRGAGSRPAGSPGAAARRAPPARARPAARRAR